MENGLLSKYFKGIVAKKLSQVEVNPQVSNQHEFNGINEFKSILGAEKSTYEGIFIYLTDNEETILNETGSLTWYNARENDPKRNEFRLYYSTTQIMEKANVGDFLLIGLTHDNKLAVVVAPTGTTAEQQLLWLFEIGEIGSKFIFRDISSNDIKLNFAGKYILNSLGFEIDETEPNFLELILNTFGNQFPSTAIFSNFARSTVKNVSPIEEPDKTLIAWLEREEILFKTLEKHIVSKKLEQGFGENKIDVDDFISFSLSVQNRRKSRAGFAFENHLASIFQFQKISFSKGAKTERNNKPDFLFPSIIDYHNPDFPVELLTMLGVKTTAKDRWRQVLSEADKISQKHLITLEPAISVNQTDEMFAQNLQLVIPQSLKETFTASQQINLLNLQDFINVVRQRQK
ncbi:EcoRII-like protein [Flavobacterium sp. 90]|uniref:type II restriction endonuclease n=1 Tax=unclassified Flavobacterium TaxID=196869 RepID=UPI000EAD9DFA|nr:MULTISPECIES: type II restriction endonuclease [unclassified Flavobacterium]RKR09866.1 EcoRII-like protein [Flavobacterium sp. 81]TCK53651.1 EcoRII-like protein [Flavobacterium sp. 90]